MKDPVLQSYSMEELMYEFQSIKEFKKAREEQAEQESDKIEEEKDKEAQSWADKLEAEELEAEELDPAKDPDNIRWMEEQLAKDKENYGEDFGEEFNLNFDSPPILKDE